MSKCRKCNIEILDETERCPLCNSVLVQTMELENMYPNVRIKARKLMLISRIYLFCAILLEVLLVYINVVTDSRTWWSIITALSFVYVYMLIRFAILGTSGYKSKVIVLTLIAVLIAVASDFVNGYQGWSVNYALPSGILLIDLGILVLMFTNRRNWQSYMMWQILMILFSVIPLVFSLVGIATAPFLGELSFVASVLLFVGTLIIGDRRARTELKRRFHIR
ncbi:MAG: DUF6320 domain-containing protein [Roseburia sp.]|nr:DUF6320 domain-containing protein [Roseburia sp.]